MIDLWTRQLSCGYYQFWLFYFSKNNTFKFFSDFQFISNIKFSSIIVLIKCNFNNTRRYPFWLYLSFSWKKSSNCDKFRQNFLPFHNQLKIWTRSVHSILWLGRPNLDKNCTIVYCIHWCLHIVHTIIIWVAMLGWIIRSYPCPEVVTFSLIHYNTNNNLAPSNGTHFGPFLCILKVIF